MAAGDVAADAATGGSFRPDVAVVAAAVAVGEDQRTGTAVAAVPGTGHGTADGAAEAGDGVVAGCGETGTATTRTSARTGTAVNSAAAAAGVGASMQRSC